MGNLEVFFSLNFIKKRLDLVKNKRGMSTIEIVIGVIIFLMLFCLLFDLFTIMWKFSVIAHTNTQVARIAGVQGGVLKSAPEGYPGGDSNYITVNELNDIVRDKFASAWIKDGEWGMKVGNGSLGREGIKPAKHDYLQDFTVEVEVDYEWVMVSNFIPGNLKQTITSKRPAMGEWKYNYDDWIGE